MKRPLLIILLSAMVLSLSGCETVRPPEHAPVIETLSDAVSLIYTGNPSEEMNGNVPYFTEEEITSARNNPEEAPAFSSLDRLERPGTAQAVVGKDTMPSSERPDMDSIKPAGWVQAKYDGIDNGGWLYNRCHLIAWSLLGNNEKENLMTGTRYFNTKGMLPYEIKILEYLDNNPDNHVLYRVMPAYSKDDLVAKGVRLEAYSIEDNGGLSFCAYIHNVQPGITIHYRTGKSERKEGNRT